MASRSLTRLRATALATVSALRRRTRSKPKHPKTILVLHELLLGDTLMLAPLLAELRQRYPSAAIFVTARPEFLPVFSGRPYRVQALPFTERDSKALASLAPARDCDLAFVVGDNRYALIARALGATWIVALEQPESAWKNRLPDERVPFPLVQLALPEIFASLAGPRSQLRYRPGDWPAPRAAPYSKPPQPYVLLHLGASTPLKYWPSERWAALAGLLDRHYQIVLSAGKKEAAVISQVDSKGQYVAYPGDLDLAQLWHLVSEARLLVTLDTGVAHLAKLTGTPAVCLYGPGSAALVGRGEFWAAAPFHEVTVPDFPCRDQKQLFKREVPWVRRCGRSLTECSRPRCMEAITLDDVARAVRAALKEDVLGPKLKA